MTPRICVCCGEPMSARGNVLSRNPNICASCSSLADGMDEPAPLPFPTAADLAGGQSTTALGSEPDAAPARLVPVPWA